MGKIALAVAIAVVAGSVAYATFTGTDVEFPESPPDSIGFAVWPEDTFEEAREGCLERSDEEPWRLSHRETVLQYSRDVLGYPNPRTDGNDASPEQSGGVSIVYDDRMRRDSLGTVINTRREGSCWFVTQVQPREGGSVGMIAQLPGDRILVGGDTGGRGSRAVVEVGFGTETRRTPAATSGQAIFKMDSDEPGHWLLLYRNPREWGEEGARVLHPLLDDSPGMRVRRGGYALWPDVTKAENEKHCKRAQRSGRPRIQNPNESIAEGQPWRAAPRPLLTWFVEGIVHGHYPDVGYFDGLESFRLERTSDPLVWEATEQRGPMRDRRKIRITLRSVRGGCFAVRSVTMPGSPVGVRTWMAPDRGSLSFDWGPADRAGITFGQGVDQFGARIRKVDLPVTFAAELKRGRPGFYLVFLHEGRRIVGLEGAALEPLR